MKHYKLANLIHIATTLISVNICYASYNGCFPTDFLYLKNIDPSIQQDIRYAGYHNFVGRPIDGYQSSECILTQKAALALKAVQTELRQSGLGLKVYDCYRPTRAVRDFMHWSKDTHDQTMKNEFYPIVDKKNFFKLGYVAEQSGHSRGSTMDLTIVSAPLSSQSNYKTGQPLKPCTADYVHRFHDNSIDMGTGFDCMDEKSHNDNHHIPFIAYHNRQLLKQLMEKHGFVAYQPEWWHFTLKNEPYPNRYFDCEVTAPIEIKKQFAALEKKYHGKMGVYAFDANKNISVAYDANQLFPLCSTAKLMIVAAILKQSMKDHQLMKKIIHYQRRDVDFSGYAPVTSNYLKTGMSIADLCKAAITKSDNAAANLLMKRLGGPSAVTRFAHSIGNQSFRLDRWEPQLNTAIPGDKRDTAAPKDMTDSLKRLVLGNILGASQKEKLVDWLTQNTTGKNRIRAGVPHTWRVANKTGTGGYGTTNDIAILWPSKRSPVVMAIYFTQAHADDKPSERVISKATRITMKSLRY